MVAKLNSQDGYIALLAVLIIGSAALAISLTLLMTGTDSQRTTLVQQQSRQARLLANACAQESLQVIHDDTSYAGSDTLTQSEGNCSYTVTVTSGTTRTILATGTVSGVVIKVQIYVTIGSSSISITSWQEVGS